MRHGKPRVSPVVTLLCAHCQTPFERPLHRRRMAVRRHFCSLACRNAHGANTTHGSSDRHGGTPEYRTWRSMKSRCLSHGNKRFADYGGRGITVCDRWMRFEDFLSDMGTRPLGTTLDRIDNSRGYEPGNCRWTTRIEQQNNMRSNVRLAFGGETLTIAEWSRRTGIHSSVIGTRLRRGWSEERALTPPRWSRSSTLALEAEDAR